MTDSKYTALLLIIDRSGSMMGIRDDMVGGLHTMLTQQAAQPGLMTVDIVVFDDVIERVASLADPATVTVTIEPRGSTALYDAIGIGVQGFGQILAGIPEHARPSTVQVIVVTDGGENSSTEWSADAVRTLIRTQTDTYKWDFVFMGANQDAVLTGAHLGFAAESSMTYGTESDQVDAMTATMGRYVTDLRSNGKAGFSPEERNGAAGN